MFNSTDVIGIFGRRGTGKSYLGGQIQKAYPRRIIFDTTFEYNGENIAYNFEQFSEFILNHENASKFELVVRFDIENSQKNAQFDEMIKILYLRGSVLIVIEEIQNFCNPHYISPFLEHIFTTGRHRDLAIIFTSQRPGQTHKTAISQCTHIFAGNLIDKNDRAYVSNFLGQDASLLSNMPERNFLWWRPGNLTFLDENFRKKGVAKRKKLSQDIPE